MPNKTYSIDEIKHNLATNPKWTERAIIKLYEWQTADEQEADVTKYHNNVGFNGGDAPRLSYYAKYLLSGRHLTGHHLEKAQKMVKKYSSQIQSLINQNSLS